MQLYIYIYVHNKRAVFFFCWTNGSSHLYKEQFSVIFFVCVCALFILQDRLEAYYYCVVCIEIARYIVSTGCMHCSFTICKDTTEWLVMFRTKIALTIKPALVKATHSTL